MANVFLTPDVIARTTLLLLESNMVATMLFDRNYESEFTGNERIGDTVTIRRRDAAAVTEYNGSTVTAQELTETGIALVMEKHYDATIKVTSKDMTLEIQDFASQVLEPTILNIAETVDAYCLTKLKDLPNVLGPASGGVGSSALPASIADMAGVRRGMNDLKIPMRGRQQIVSTEYEESLLSVDSFVEADKSGTSQALREAAVGRLLGIDTWMDQNVDSAAHTTGAGGEAGTINGALAKGATTLVVASMGAAATYLVNDILTIAGYGNVVVAANATMDGSGDGSITIKEPLRAAVADTTVITPFATGDTWEMHGAAFHPRCFAFASVPLALPRGGVGASVIGDRGISIRVVYDYDRNLKSDVLSLDVLCGAKMVDGRLGGQILKA